MMAIQYREVREWPTFAWLAVCLGQVERVTVLHGSGVECGHEWFGEIVWPGPFEAGDFDCAEVVTGSGGRIRDGRLVFVSSSSTVDRLQFMERRGGVLVSNSLPCLLHGADTELSSSFPSYNRKMASIARGLQRYERTLETTGGSIRLSYFDHLAWDGRSLTRVPKPTIVDPPASFTEYASFLEQSMKDLFENASSNARKAPLSPLATASTGYDSPAVATLAQRAGCKQVLCFDVSTAGSDDSGSRIAQVLGLEVLPVTRNRWRKEHKAEIPVIAGGHPGAVIFTGAASLLAGRLLLTGYHGDKVWSMHNPDLSPHIVRGDASGLGLTEFRLWAGFLHAPVPFWGCRAVAAIDAISHSDEMRPFVLGYTDYDRPICRRVLEEAGVSRDWFGVEKKAAEAILWQERRFLSDRSYEDYFYWLGTHRSDWVRRGRVPPWRSVRGDLRVNAVLADSAAVVRRVATRVARWMPSALPGREMVDALRSVHPRLVNLRRYVFPWAVARASERYAALDPAQIEV